jgi:tetratricopeptide (TPR) repeat protein
VPSVPSKARPTTLNPVFPEGPGTITVLRDALERNSANGEAALYLGHVFFHQRRYSEGRQMWQRAAELGASPSVAYRALGMSSLTMDKDTEMAARFLKQAHQADPADPIVGRDLARVLCHHADKANTPAAKTVLWTEAWNVLQPAFPAGQGRSDFVSLLARVQNRLGDYARTAKLLDSARITVWEGSREAHDLFEEAHLALGRAHLAAGRSEEALREFDRALEYPENLATGKLENAKEGHIHALRAEALTALGRTEAAAEARAKAGQ